MTDDLVKRSMEGETYAGLEVMAYMEDCGTPMGIIPRFSSHWSTPGAGAKNVQRLFSQSQVDGLLARISALEAALAKADAHMSEGRYPAKSGQPTATKERGAEWYYPAVTCEYGRPMRLPHGSRHETRGKAKAEARRLIREAFPAQQEGAKG